MFTLKDLIRNFYPSQHLIIYIMGGKELHTTTKHLDELNPICLDFIVRTIEIHRDELGKLKDILRIIVTKV